MSPERKEKPFDLEESFYSTVEGLKDELLRARTTAFMIIARSGENGLDITQTGALRRRLGKAAPLPIINTAVSYVANYYSVMKLGEISKKSKTVEELQLSASIKALKSKDLQKEAIQVLQSALRRAKKLPTSRR